MGGTVPKRVMSGDDRRGSGSGIGDGERERERERVAATARKHFSTIAMTTLYYTIL